MSRCILILIILPSLGSCGTMANMAGLKGSLLGNTPTESGKPRIYGGVVNDITLVKASANRVVNPEYPPWDSPINLGLMAYFGVIDLPLSLVGDTITLPKVILERYAEASSVTPNDEPMPELNCEK